MRKLGWTTVGFTYFLMVWGNLVSSTGSGLACPGWPLCRGTIVPTPTPDVILEWGHRLLAFVTTCLIVTTIYRVLRAPQSAATIKAGSDSSTSTSTSALKRSGRSLLVLLGIQIGLGATTVLLKLSATVSTIHLIVATIVLSGLITVACTMTWGTPLVANPSPKVRRLAVTGMAGMLIQLALGALVRHTHSGLACPNFPNCLGGFFPIPFFFGTAIAFIHRWWGFALLGVFVHLGLGTPKHCPELATPARVTLGLSIVQVGLGILTVLTGLQTELRATHAAVGYALWAFLFYIALRSGAVRWIWERPGAQLIHANG